MSDMLFLAQCGSVEGSTHRAAPSGDAQKGSRTGVAGERSPNGSDINACCHGLLMNAAKLAANIDVNGALTGTDVGQTCEKMMHSIARIRRAHPAPVKE